MAVWPPQADDEGFDDEKENDEGDEQWYDQMVD